MDNKKRKCCTAYYILIAFYVLFMPLMPSIVIFIIEEITYPGTISDIENIIYIIIESPIFTALVTFLYAYLCIGKFKINKPDSMFRLYLPIFMYLGWQLFVSVMFLLSVNNNAYDYFTLSWNSYGWDKTDFLQRAILFNCIYNFSLLGGFAAGERLAFRKTKVMRKPFRIKYVCLVLRCCVRRRRSGISNLFRFC